TKLILPGVGAFDHAMALLDDSGMRPALDDLVLVRKDSYQAPGLKRTPVLAAAAQASRKMKKVMVGPWLDVSAWTCGR
ncbi:hypothetical protein Q6253_31805, partial [Klebsiella quasipneumoniae]|nr:hypothetical protein [Klebsiella quasipneumoniae]